MAAHSGYALPKAGASPIRSAHGHSRSYHGYLSPAKGGGSNGSNGNGTLHTLLETSPLHSPEQEANRQIGDNHVAFNENKRTHTHSKRHPSPMKSRGRGESDLGRPPDPRGSAYTPRLNAVGDEHEHGHSHSSSGSIPELLTGLLVPLPYMLASAAYSTPKDPSSTYESQSEISLGGTETTIHGISRPGLLEACTLTAGTLLLVGFAAKIGQSQRVLDRRKEAATLSQQARGLMNVPTIQAMGMRMTVIGLPLYAAMEIGGMRVGLALVTAISSNILCSDTGSRPAYHEWKHLLSSRTATLAVLASCALADFSGLTTETCSSSLLAGYLALACSLFVLPYPLPRSTKSHSGTKASTSLSSLTSNLVATTADTNVTLASGLLLSLVTLVGSTVFPMRPASSSDTALGITSIALMALSFFFSQPTTLRSQRKAGLGTGCLLSASCAFLFSSSIGPSTMLNGGISALAFLGVLYDTTTASKRTHHGHDHDHDHAHNAHSHDHGHGHHHAHAHAHAHAHDHSKHSMFTGLLISRCEPGSVAHGVLSEKDSRRIAYFTCLNFGFMIVQGIYGYLSGSLGLLSDTVHMFFDCLGLVIGLAAAVASKWSTSPEKPYGWGKLNTLAGFGNGIFLMLVSVEFVWEALEGIMEGKELRRVTELLIVSTLGLLVNMVGLVAFGHAHHGHDHGHDHGHPHGHSHGHDHSHDHNHDHSHSHSNGHAHGDHRDHDHEHKSPAPPSHDAHAHAHNENMHGIYLHVAADAGGSLAVIISTALTLWKPWYLWDPLATILIATLIFLAAVPLVTSSGQKLLLVVPTQLEYGVKNTLQEIAEIRGVVGYAVPRFWIDDKDAAAGGHQHHGHSHGGEEEEVGGQVVLGVIHVIAGQAADVEDVRQRVEDFVRERGMDLVVHVEHEGEGCWCGGGQGRAF